jgi:type II secretory pathway component PulM
MTGYLDRLNLRPFEKRLVVGVGAVLFVVLNAWFVVPHFSDLSQARERRLEALKKLELWQAEMDQKSKYEAGINKFRQEGLEVPPEDQQNQFAHVIQDQQARSGVGLQQFGRVTTQTNQFFLELTQPITVQSGEEQLVDFLYRLGSGNSLIRVRDLTLRPDAPRQQLSGTVKLVASYQKNPPKKATPAASPAAANTKMTTSTAKRP